MILKTKKNFSLVELIVSMTILAILILASTTFFTTAQKTWTSTEEKRSVFEDARIALDLISRDLECAYYGDGTAPFWHWNGNRPSAWGQYRNELIAFVSDTPIPSNNVSTSTLCEVKYQLYYATNSSDDNFGWLRRSVTSNRLSSGAADPKWNFFNNTNVGYTTASATTPVSAFTADSQSSQDYQDFIPYVVDFSDTCYAKDGSIIPPDATTSDSNDSCYLSGLASPNIGYFPYSVEVSITLMDSASWEKWMTLSGFSTVPDGDSGAAQAFRLNHQRTFSRMIYLGNKGQ